jgi:agmatine deiminase
MSLPAGVRMAAETAPHERTLIAWPTETRRASLWGGLIDEARAVHATVARVVARHESVTVVAAPQDAPDAARACGADVDVVGLPIDDSWMRDSGPIVVLAPDGARHAVHFRFNAWGEKYSPYTDDAAIGARVADHLGLPVHEAPFVLEGGAIATDGAGTFVTTERCLLNPNREPGRTRSAVEEALRHWLGAHDVIWLADGIAEDDETDGHVDNVVAFAAPRRVLLQRDADPLSPNHAIATDSRHRLRAAGLDVVDVPALPYTEVEGRRVPVPYVNFYVANEVVLVPVTGAPSDAAALEIIGGQYPGREVVGVPGTVLAYGGGGVHCITQPIPAAPSDRDG